MPTVWSDIKDSVRDALRDRTQNFISDDELLRYLKRVLRRVDQASTYAFQETQNQITVVGSQIEYDLVSFYPDFKELYTVTTATAGQAIPFELQYTNLKDFQLVSDGLVFSVRGTSTLILYSPLALSLNGSLLNITYFSRYFWRDAITDALKEMPTSDADYCAFPERFVDILVEGILMFAFKKDRSHREDATDAEGEFLSQLKMMMMEESRRVKRGVRFAKASF